MPRSGPNLDELFDRPYRPGTAFGPRISPLRRWGMLCVLMLLVGVIFTYWALTDTRRVRAMAESYLSQLTGGHVEVKNATLSIFEGLRLDGVSVHVDDDAKPDSMVFRAGTILIKYNPQSILSGKLEATQIVALDPQVRLCENIDTGKWNWQRTAQETKAPRKAQPGMKMKFPEILLRNAQVVYSRMQSGNILGNQGLMEIEGSVKPLEDGSLGFTVQSRGEAQAIGPVVKGNFNPESKAVAASLENFRFGKDIEVMLPEQVRQWWTHHGLAGEIDIPAFYVNPGKNGEKSKFRIETDLKNVTLNIMPEEWLSREENRRLAALRRTVGLMKDLGLNSSGMVTQLQGMFDPTPVELDKVAGRFVFTDEGIDIDRVAGWVEKNPFHIKGRIDGYSAESAATITVQGENITIPHSPRYVTSMPPAFRELYEHLRPEGDGSLLVKIERLKAGDKPKVSGRIDILDGQFVFDMFPYPLRKVTGMISFGWDEKLKMDRLDVDMVGMGVADGPNKDVPVDVKGFVGPLGKGDAQFDFWVTTNNVNTEPALTHAYPKPVQEALKIFDAPGKGELPRYHGGFVAHVYRPYGPNQKWFTVVDVNLDDAKGQLVFFPYPVEHLTGKLHVTDDHVDVMNASIKHGDASFVVDGVVKFGKDKPIDPFLKVTARDLPIDAHLLAALPKERREWLEKVGASGRIDIDGVVQKSADAGKGGAASGAGGKPEDAITYDMNVHLKDGAFWPAEGVFAVSGVTGALRLTPTQLLISEMQGHRGKADVSGNGLITWAGGKPRIVMSASAKNLALDAGLYKMLPVPWREGWDQARPEGSVDLDVSYSGLVGEVGSATTQRTATTLPAGEGATTGSEVAGVGGAGAGEPVGSSFQASIKPVKLSMTPRVIPVRLDEVKGQVVIRPDRITLSDITAKRKSGGTVAYSGTVPTASNGAGGPYELALSVKDIVADKELKTALPPSLGKLLDSMKVEGKLTADFPKLIYRAPTEPKGENGDLEFTAALTLNKNSVDVGMPMTDVEGTMNLKGASHNGSLAGLTGSFDFTTLKLGGREVTNLKAELIKPESDEALRIGKISGEVAAGKIAGQIDLVFPEKGASRYGLGLVLRNADVRQLVGQGEKDIKGQLTASLAIEGNWGEAGSRRGRGDVSVTGKDMYRIPLVLGLMQITNLSLPISSPFNDAAVRYSVEGERINFEQIELRASNMLMSGDGWLDFGNKKVSMTFVTDNPNAWKIPFLHELFQGARQEFMQIRVSGSVQEPKVSGNMMNTFSTTVDEVLNGDRAGNRRNGKK